MKPCYCFNSYDAYSGKLEGLKWPGWNKANRGQMRWNNGNFRSLYWYFFYIHSKWEIIRTKVLNNRLWLIVSKGIWGPQMNSNDLEFRCSKLAAVCMISDAVCMFIYLFMMNYFPTNMTNMIYLIDSNINLISLIMIQKSWRIVIFPWKREKLNYRMSDRSFFNSMGP